MWLAKILGKEQGDTLGLTTTTAAYEQQAKMSNSPSANTRLRVDMTPPIASTARKMSEMPTTGRAEGSAPDAGDIEKGGLRPLQLARALPRRRAEIKETRE